MMTQGSLRPVTLVATALALMSCIPGPIYHGQLVAVINALDRDRG
jgi:hypothetical protein